MYYKHDTYVYITYVYSFSQFIANKKLYTYVIYMYYVCTYMCVLHNIYICIIYAYIYVHAPKKTAVMAESFLFIFFSCVIRNSLGVNYHLISLKYPIMVLLSRDILFRTLPSYDISHRK